MKQLFSAVVFVIMVALAGVAVADKDLPVFKKGDPVYVCGCGDGCGCYTLSRKAGNCSCNKPLVKTTVARVEGDKLYAKVQGKELSFVTKAKFACACGEGCNCGTISQKPGKCGCGREMKAVK
jgi:hypothetical protein